MVQAKLKQRTADPNYRRVMTSQLDPLRAVTHADPWPYYRRLSSRPFHYAPELACWIAASAGDATCVLQDERCQVRPRSEPIPQAIAGVQAGAIFGRLVRMTDGAAHHRLREAVVATLLRFSEQQITAMTRRAADLLQAAHPSDFAYGVPVYTLGLLIGVPERHLPRLGELMAQFAPCLGPGSPPDALQAGIATAPHLCALIETHLDPAFAPQLDAGERSANAIGLLWQNYDSTASLILHGVQQLRKPVADAGWEAALKTLVRNTTPIQNTRRFMAEDGELLGQFLRAGDPILIVLAAANQTLSGVGLSFGRGQHQCPGQRAALMIAEHALKSWLTLPPPTLPAQVRYKPSANARIPLPGGPE